MNPEANDLSGLLREWREAPVGDPTLAERVVREIRGGTVRSRRTAGAIFSLRMAVAGIAAGVVCGVALAEWRAQRVDASQMPQRYLAWIDPQTGERP